MKRNCRKPKEDPAFLRAAGFVRNRAKAALRKVCLTALRRRPLGIFRSVLSATPQGASPRGRFAGRKPAAVQARGFILRERRKAPRYKGAAAKQAAKRTNATPHKAFRRSLRGIETKTTPAREAISASPAGASVLLRLFISGCCILGGRPALFCAARFWRGPLLVQVLRRAFWCVRGREQAAAPPARRLCGPFVYAERGTERPEERRCARRFSCGRIFAGGIFPPAGRRIFRTDPSATRCAAQCR